MQIEIDNLTGPDVIALLRAHVDDMKAVSPPGSTHVLDLDGLRRPGITFWTARDDGVLAGCAALRQLDAGHGEIKSMRTAREFLGRGAASLLLRHLIAEAERRGYRRLSLETGSLAYFEPARNLYAKHGFQPCPPFAHYRDDPNSVFLARNLS